MTRREIIKQGGMAVLGLALLPSWKTLKHYNLMKDGKNFDVIIIGGSYAGLSAAMTLGRSLKRTLIIDSGLPCNRQTPHSHNFITQDGEAPAAIAAKAREQVLRYDTVSFLNDLAVGGRKSSKGFIVKTSKGEELEAKKLIFATGIKDLIPDIRGFKECWGISVVHCPYCHGYEIKGKRTGIMANGERAFHLASLVNNLTDSLTLLCQGEPDFSEEQKEKLKKHKINIVEAEIAEIENTNGQIKNVLFKDGSKMNFDSVYAAIPFTQHSDVPAFLGCNLTESGHLEIDHFQKTNVAGVYACGDNSSMMRSVANAVYTGNLAGAMVNKELTDEQF